MKNNPLFLVGGLVLGVVIVSKLFKDQIANVNEGTPFEGAGVVGTLGNATNAASGGILANVGSAIGEFFSGSIFDRRDIDDLTGT